MGPDWHEGLEVHGISIRKQIRVEFQVEIKRVWTRKELIDNDEAKNKLEKSTQDIAPILVSSVGIQIPNMLDTVGI